MTSELVYEAWRAVRRNRGAAGIDKVSIQMFEQNLEANLERLMRELKQGTFQPLAARRVYIPKDAKGTKLRPLGIPTLAAYCTCFNEVWGSWPKNFAARQSAKIREPMSRVPRLSVDRS